MRALLRFAASLPERVVCAVAAVGGGAVHETAELLLPRLVRRSRLYEATAKNLLRITVELVGGVERPGAGAGEVEPSAGRLAVRKTAGNVVEIGSIAAFGFSPLWLLAAAAQGGQAARARALHGGSATRSRRGLRRLCASRRPPVRARSRPAVRPCPSDARRARDRPPRPPLS